MESNSEQSVAAAEERLKIAEISKVLLTPDDTLVFKFHKILTQKEMADIGEDIKIIFPGIRFIILDEETDLQVVHETR